METRKRNVLISKTPLVAIVMIALMSGAAFAAVYWSSMSFTKTITIAGQIVAKANVDVANCLGTMKPNYAAVPIVTDFKPTDKVYVLVDAANSATLMVSVTKTGDAGITVTCTAKLMHLGGTPIALNFVKDLGTVVVGGASIDTSYNSDPLWLAKSGYTNLDGLHLLELTFTFSNGVIPIGSYPVAIVLHLGDNI